MRMFIFILIHASALWANSQGQILISGQVEKEVDLQVNSGIVISGNSEFIIDLEDKTGQMHRHFLQYNQKFNITDKKIEKIVVYAP